MRTLTTLTAVALLSIGTLALAEEVRPGVFRTPDERFENLPDYPFEPNYVEVDGKGGKLRVHYVDVGPRDGKVVVFLHGNPTWSYEWRNIIPPTARAGYRVIALDMVGLGRSDKPNAMEDYSVANHVEWMRQAMIDELNLRDITLVGHDWGGIIGPRIVALHPNRFSRLVFSNSGLPSRDPAEPLPDPIPEATGFLGTFQKMVKNDPDWALWDAVQQFTPAKLSQAEIDAFHAPFPDSSYLHGPRQFTQMLPTRVDNPQLPDNFVAWKTLHRFTGPTLTIFGAKDPASGGGGRGYHSIPGAAGQPHVVLAEGGHFLQEDDPEGYIAALIPWLKETDSAVPDRTAALTADDIPVGITTHTYDVDLEHGILDGCTEPLAEGVVDIRGTWEVYESTQNGKPTQAMVGTQNRIEQCGDRIVISSGPIIHDMRADGTYENGVNDLSEPSLARLISVSATWENGVHVLRPKGLPIRVERELDGDTLIWRYGPISTRLKRVD